MQSFFEELKKEARGLNYFLLNITIVIWNLGYSLFAALIINKYGFFGSSEVIGKRSEEILEKIISDYPLAIFFTALAFMALAEEITFRWAPIFIPRFFIEKIASRWFPEFIYQFLTDKLIQIILVSALLASIIFGWVHGGFIFIFIQGIIGFIWSLLFIKCGGYRGGFSGYRKALLTTFVSHFTYNAVIIISVIYYLNAYN